MVSFSQVSPNGFVVDASLIVGVIQGLPEARRFAPLLKSAFTSSVTLGETFYIIHRRAPKTTHVVIESAMVGLGVTVEPVSIEIVRHFNALKDIDGLRVTQQLSQGVLPVNLKKLSLGDMICLGQAMTLNLPVLTGDKHWLTLSEHGLGIDLWDFRDPQLVI